MTLSCSYKIYLAVVVAVAAVVVIVVVVVLAAVGEIAVAVKLINEQNKALNVFKHLNERDNLLFWSWSTNNPLPPYFLLLF